MLCFCRLPALYSPCQSCCSSRSDNSCCHVSLGGPIWLLWILLSMKTRGATRDQKQPLSSKPRSRCKAMVLSRQGRNNYDPAPMPAPKSLPQAGFRSHVNTYQRYNNENHRSSTCLLNLLMSRRSESRPHEVIRLDLALCPVCLVPVLVCSRSGLPR